MRILLVDDDEQIGKAMSVFLENHMGHDVTVSRDPFEAVERFEENPFPLVLLDIRLPGMNGIEVLKRIKKHPRGASADVVMVTAHGELRTAIESLRAGAYDYLEKPPEVEELAALVERVSEHQALLRENIEYSRRFEEKLAEATRETVSKLEHLQSAYAEVVGIGRFGVFSDAMRDVVRMAGRLHRDRSVPVLIEGETGTGKEIIARLVHYGDGEVTTPFVSLNCSAISPHLFESELFGYEGGAYSGALQSGMMGKLELAQGGTLFLDEIGDLPQELQPKLLRTIQEREIYRVGGLKKIALDVRIVCATNRDLESMVRDGAFRRDLFYRLNTGRIHIPPLRDRSGEIGPLAQLFLENFAGKKKRRFSYISRDVVRILEAHTWPGNVRELENVIERVVLLYDGSEVLPEHVAFLATPAGGGAGAPHTDDRSLTVTLPEEGYDLSDAEARILRKGLALFDGNKTKTAAYFGLSLSTFKRKAKKYGIG